MDVLSVFAAAHAVGETPAWIFGDRTWTYAELGARVSAAAAWLGSRGVEPGELVAFRATPEPGPLLALFAITAASGTAVPLHPRWTEAEVRAALATIGPCRRLGEEDVAALLRASAQPARARVRPRESGHPWAVLFTSGTSGVPKGVALPARALVASARASAQVLPFARRERWLLSLMPAHVGGLSILTRSLLARKTVVALDRFDPARVLDAVRKHAVSRLSVVPAMLDPLLAEDRGNRLRRLGAVVVGGAACPRALLEHCASRGVRARATYGLTETCSQVTLQRTDVTRGVGADAGAPLPGVDVEVVPDGLGADGEGRIRVRGPVVAAGYLRARPRGKAAALAPFGEWLDTGDRGRLLPDGTLLVLGRGAEMIVTGGENVAPVEVERALEACAGVRQALVFGVPDPRFGEVVAAAVVADRRVPLDERHLAARLAQSLARFKQPRRLAIVEGLPRTPSGKPDRAGAAKLLAQTLRPWPHGAP